VAELWTFPVKSMLGERLDRVDLTERGVFGDRGELWKMSVQREISQEPEKRRTIDL
jgi:uncharacterized protein YcbX